MSTIDTSQLGKTSDQPSAYAPDVLNAIPRAAGRAALGLADDLPFVGVDIWNAYELSWLAPQGKPLAAMAEIRVPCDSPNLIESKSMKLYLNSLNAERYPSAAEVAALLRADLTRECGADVEVTLSGPVDTQLAPRGEWPGECIDDVAVEVRDYTVNPELLRADAGEIVSESLHTHLFKSNCPVTGQPDWASVQVSYHGPRIDRGALLAYLVSFRNVAEFHEQCVERLFCDIERACAAQRLSVYARYTRRGGLDINPFRSNAEKYVDNVRLPRQ